MTRDMHGAGFLGRAWRSFLAVSEVAVAIRYDAPWRREGRSPLSGPRAVACPGNALLCTEQAR